MGQDWPEKNSAKYEVLDRYRSTKPNDRAMKSERGALVSGSDPPSEVGHSVHKTTGDRWRAPARRLIQTHLGAAVLKAGEKNIDPSPMANIRPFLRFGRRAWDVSGNFSRPRSRIHMISSRPSSTFTGLARHEPGWPWVASISRSKVYRRVSCF